MWADYLIFLLKTVTIVVAIGSVVILVVGAATRHRDDDDKGHIKVEDLSKKLDRVRQRLEEAMATDHKLLKKQRKAEKKAEKQEAKVRAKSDQDSANAKPTAWVVDFKGDMSASQVKSLAETVTAIVTIAQPGETVLIRLESPGGVVHGYGLAASQLARLKQHGLKLEIVVDKVAASGGYMMAALADRIIAAPFAVVGSIGVVAQLPNIHRFLKKNDIDVELHTAGEFKRTLTMIGENTDAGRAKFKEDLENTHRLFKEHVAKARPSLDIDAVANGEFWYGSDAVENGLVDEISTSDDVILKLHDAHRVMKVSFETPKPLAKRLSIGVMAMFDDVLARLSSRHTPYF
ncbi:protease SohB [Salinispirillum sp. LH 10-3-1]|uniref:Protease SohB n=1 Tax=Salinispirillum sp. LH 10-3-1 TaxID=2952525 RepID=A0AB38YJ80_9GAMM